VFFEKMSRKFSVGGGTAEEKAKVAEMFWVGVLAAVFNGFDAVSQVTIGQKKRGYEERVKMRWHGDSWWNVTAADEHWKELSN
jgi:hypothetical protein